MKQLSAILLAWWFWAGYRGVGTIGPFDTKERCEQERTYMHNRGYITAEACWEGYAS